MNDLIIEVIPDMPFYPEVKLIAKTGVCEIAGESYMEETHKFYQPIKEWIENYSKQGASITFDFKLTYFNTSTSRVILDILELLKKHRDAGHQLKVNWHYRATDPDMIDEVEDFESESDLTINLVELN